MVRSFLGDGNTKVGQQVGEDRHDAASYRHLGRGCIWGMWVRQCEELKTRRPGHC